MVFNDDDGNDGDFPSFLPSIECLFAVARFSEKSNQDPAQYGVPLGSSAHQQVFFLTFNFPTMEEFDEVSWYLLCFHRKR